MEFALFEGDGLHFLNAEKPCVILSCDKPVEIRNHKMKNSYARKKKITLNRRWGLILHSLPYRLIFNISVILKSNTRPPLNGVIQRK